MAKFAKIIELDNEEQVLLTLNYNAEDDCHEIEQRTNYLGMVMKMALVFKTREKAEEVLKIYSKVDALNFISSLNELLK